MKTLITIFIYLFVVFADCAEFSIFFTGDSHGVVLPETLQENLYSMSAVKSGGAAYMTALYRKESQDYKNNILISCGDIFDGSYITDSFEGKPQIEFMNAVPYTIFTPGNHDFRFSVDRLKKYCDESKFKTVNTNIVGSDTYNNVFEESIILDINGSRIGFLAFLTLDGGYDKKILEEGNINIIDPFQIVSHYIEKLRKKDVDYIILINHLGLDKDRSIAKKFSPDMIIGGHSHSVLKKYEKIEDTYIFHSGSYLQYLGHIILDIEEGKVEFKDYRLLRITSRGLQEDSEIKQIISKYHNSVKDEMDMEITYLKKSLNKNSRELYYFLTDNVREIIDADISIINTSGIRSGLKAGKVTAKDIYKVLPWEDKAVLFTAKGQIIISEGFLTRKKVDKDKEYKIVTNSYVYERINRKYNLKDVSILKKSFRELINDNLKKKE